LFAFRLEESAPEPEPEPEAIVGTVAASVPESQQQDRIKLNVWKLNGMPPLWLRQVEPIPGERSGTGGHGRIG
jgi:hypothetical protein